VLSENDELILREVEEGVGAKLSLELVQSGLQSGVKLWFSDLGRSRSPIVQLSPVGLRRFVARLSFGNFAADTISQMQRAEAEDVSLARALISSLSTHAVVQISDGQSPDDWSIHDGAFFIVAERRNIDQRYTEETIAQICRELVIPMLAAMAELYGYDPIDENPDSTIGEYEGQLLVTQVRRRERNPRNRLLCLRLHNYRCVACGVDPLTRYRTVGQILEVHHLQPLALADEPRRYSPATDLVPLCPNCHRAIHTRRPVPWSLEELKSMLVG
jgi:5-methylcytosine-specific restriction protein A